jgi:hypothetical protein
LDFCEYKTAKHSQMFLRTQIRILFSLFLLFSAFSVAS